jgi:hypothetical protein
MRPLRRSAALAALMLGILAATPACAGDYRAHGNRWHGQDWQRHGWAPAPAWRHASPQLHWHRPWRPAPSWRGWRHDRPRQAWRHQGHGWGPRNRW